MWDSLTNDGKADLIVENLTIFILAIFGMIS